MDDSPRTAKRRKLDTPARNASSPRTRGSATPKASAAGTLIRPTRRNTSLATDDSLGFEVPASPSQRAKSSRNSFNSPGSTLNSTSRKRRLQSNEEDVYDDIDGAFDVDSPAKRLRNRIRGLVHQEDISGGPSPKERKAQKKKDTNAGTSRQRGRGLGAVNGTPKSTQSQRSVTGLDGAYWNMVSPPGLEDVAAQNAPGGLHATDDEDELASALATPSRRGKITRPTNGIYNRRGTDMPTESLGRRSTRLAELEQPDQDSHDQQSNGLDGHATERASITPANKRVAGRPKKMPITETNDEEGSIWRTLQSAVGTASRFLGKISALGDDDGNGSGVELKGPSRNNDRKSQTRSRRKGNFTDHIGNTDEPIIVESDPESSKDELASASGASSTMKTNGEPDHESRPETCVDDEEQPGEDDESVEEIPEPNPFQPDQKERQKPATFNKLRILSGDPNADKELTALKKITLEKLIGKRPVPLIGLDSEHRKVYNMIENTVVAGEGNSMCIIGSRGSGKSALVNKALAELSKDYREDFHIVRLNGFIHTDDKLALRDIWKQLGKEMEWEDDSLSNSYSDTLATILALLRHPFEQTGIETEEVPKAIIFVMDEFDLFALHPRQTLLYNLFDIAQSRKAPIAVLGLTTKIEITNYLEKRVKSRFSHRYVHLSLAKSFTTFQEICKAGLLLQPDELNVEERAILSQPSTSVSQPRLNKSTKDTDVLTTWNTSVEALFADRTFLTAHLSPYYYLNKSVPAVLTSFLLPISLLTSSTFPFTPSTFLSLLPPSATLAPPDSKLTLLPHLSFLQLALLIAAARLDVILDAETCSFNMAYHEYVALAGKARMQSAAAGQMASGLASKVWGRAVARVEWERLVGWELCVPVAGVGSGTMVRVDVTLEEIVASVGPGMDRVLEKWCKQI